MVYNILNKLDELYEHLKQTKNLNSVTTIELRRGITRVTQMTTAETLRKAVYTLRDQGHVRYKTNDIWQIVYRPEGVK